MEVCSLIRSDMSAFMMSFGKALLRDDVITSDPRKDGHFFFFLLYSDMAVLLVGSARDTAMAEEATDAIYFI